MEVFDNNKLLITVGSVQEIDKIQYTIQTCYVVLVCISASFYPH